MSKVAELRKGRDLTQRQLADMVGVDPSTVRNWERDRGGVEAFARLARLCKALNCTIDDLFEAQDVASLEDSGSGEMNAGEL